MKHALILLLALAAPAAFAQGDDDRKIPVLTFCKDGKVIAIQLLAAVPDIYTVVIPPDACAAKPQAAPPPRPAASKPARTT